MFLEVSEGPGTGQVLGEHRETKATHSWSSRVRAGEATDSLGLEATDAPLLGRAGDAREAGRAVEGAGGQQSHPAEGWRGVAVVATSPPRAAPTQ